MCPEELLGDRKTGTLQLELLVSSLKVDWSHKDVGEQPEEKLSFSQDDRDGA